MYKRQPYGSARLSLLTTKKTCNLSIEEVEIDESSIVPGTKLELSLIHIWQEKYQRSEQEEKQ